MDGYKRDRSRFWLKILDGKQAHTDIAANGMVRDLLEALTPGLVCRGANGWRRSKMYPDIHTLRIPNDQMDWDALERLKQWAAQANRLIWLGTNRNTRNYFSGREIDYCLAADWNFDPRFKNRTDMGRAEYQLKYNGRHVGEDAALGYRDTLVSGLMRCVHCLPFDWSAFSVTALPAEPSGQDELSWRLARHITQEMARPFLAATLHCDKPKIKDQTVASRVGIWRELLSGNSVSLSDDVRGRDLLIIDDLYQSGASVWCFAEYLKKLGARTVVAAAAVKAQKDTGNL